MATPYLDSPPLELVRVRKRGHAILMSCDPNESFKLTPVANNATAGRYERILHISERPAPYCPAPSTEFMGRTVDRVRRRKQLHAILWTDKK